MGDQNLDQFRVLQRLIKKGDLSGVRKALDAGADANLTGGHGYDLLMLAAHEGNVPLGKLLIERGADPNRLTSNNWSAAFGTLSGGHIRFLELLLEHGADPNCHFCGRLIDEWLPNYLFSSEKEASFRALLQKHRGESSK